MVIQSYHTMCSICLLLITNKVQKFLMFIGYLDTLWASFGAQLVKNPPAMQATWI